MNPKDKFAKTSLVGAGILGKFKGRRHRSFLSKEEEAASPE